MTQHSDNNRSNGKVPPPKLRDWTGQSGEKFQPSRKKNYLGGERAKTHQLMGVISLIGQGCRLSPSDFYGYPEATGWIVRRQARNVALIGLSAQLINLLTTWPFNAVLLGTGGGLLLAIIMYVLSNVCQQQAVIQQHRRAPLAMVALVVYFLLTIGWSIPAPMGIGFFRFGQDISNTFAEKVVTQDVLAPHQADVEAAQDKQRYAAEVKRECDETFQKYLDLKAANQEYDEVYRSAKGLHIHSKSPDHWNTVLTDNLPLCPKAERLQGEAQNELESAKAAQSDVLASIRSTYGRNYTVYLKNEHPLLWEGYFHPDGRLRYWMEAFNALDELFASGQFGARVLMLSAGFISFSTSLASVVLTYYYARLPGVRASWNPRTVAEYHRRVDGFNDRYGRNGGQK